MGFGGRFGVLGPLVVRDGAGDAVRVPEAKVRALLADLLVHEGRPVSADRLIDDLWGEDLPAHPANALQNKVSQLRRVLGREGVVRQPPGYRLRIDDGDVDADRFRALVTRARATGDPRARAALLTEALGLWRGPAYADFADEEFARTAALRLEEQRLTVLEERAEARLAAGEHGTLVGELTELVARHPLRERLRAAQLRALYRAGRQSEALASYDELRVRLAEELGLDPGPELAAVHRTILTQAPEPAAAPAPAARPGTRLPTPLTPLVGRERAVAEAGALLTAGRLVTLTGPGGVGKTRLAIETAARHADAFPDGVRLVELAGQRGSLADLTEVIATALGLRDDGAMGLPVPAAAPADRLAAALRDRHALLVLDNCEHVVEHVAHLTDLLLRTAPGLRVLATSQEPLGLAGETVRAVEPLPAAEAVRLFAARAAAAAPGFVLDATTTEAVEEICRRLDGLPLALELAATRVRALGVRELAHRLDDRFRVLTGTHRGAPPRQQTLRAVIDWSWELLTAPERIVLRRLAAHTDGCTLQAAEAVCAGDGVQAEEVLGLLARLVDRSLVVMTDGPRGPRYRLLESVAAYGTERLREMADLEPVRARHLHHYTELAERAAPRLRGPEQGHWLAVLDAETANLRTALDTAVRQGPAETALRLTAALSWYWLLRGRLGEARRSLESALGMPAESLPLRAEVRSLWGSFALLSGTRTPLSPAEETAEAGPWPQARWFRSYALFNAGDLAGAEALVELALAGFHERGDRWGVAAALGRRAVHALIRDDMAALRHDGERSAELFRELGDRWGRLQSVVPLAALAEIGGDYERAGGILRDGLRMAEELGLRAEVSARLSGLGRLALLAGDRDGARELHERARRTAAEQSFKFGEIHAEMGLALGARREGDLATAETHLRRIREWYEQVAPEPAGNALILAELGFVAEQRGDAEAARALHLQGLAAARLIGGPRAVALALEGLSGVEALSGSPGRAAFLLGAAAATRESAGAPLPPAERGDVDRITTAAEAAMGKAAFEEAFEHGRTTDPQEAVPAYGGERPAGASSNAGRAGFGRPQPHQARPAIEDTAAQR
ncbi:BTAD domain-containing putative transcriptional regulator [Streptomyces netropsis]|uniref:Putative ATPase/DNA-binding SARP family transcriptional activator n=1 Tax=Streptomyces netropsis TaxID=55404 RepID=A0A7W7LE61_STRNE|nr:BTAD domain-containing putative transcriptional regulator [Streptomyces netropsis]MBB4888549.1 putative ATPase/DNA-binding SARP family transcriptional activator [Streptomyces netropsis]GGR13333.1 SARP family transcriptional regulator [Streptomyces netropsis]